MGAVPKRRISRARQGERRSHLHLQMISLVECPQCHQPRLPHRACPNCGYYRGMPVIVKKEATKGGSAGR